MKFSEELQQAKEIDEKLGDAYYNVVEVIEILDLRGNNGTLQQIATRLHNVSEIYRRRYLEMLAKEIDEGGV